MEALVRHYESQVISVFLGSRFPGHGSGPLRPSYSGGDGDGDRWGGATTPEGSLNEQIVVVLARLQEDMQSVLQRLHTLEALTASQVRAVSHADWKKCPKNRDSSDQLVLFQSKYLTTAGRDTKHLFQLSTLIASHRDKVQK